MQNIIKKQNNFYDDMLEVFSSLYESSRGIEYIVQGKDRKALGMLINKYKKKNPEKTTEEARTDFENFFASCLSIKDSFYRENMSIPLINSKINEIRIILNKNGRTRKVSDSDIARIVGQ